MMKHTPAPWTPSFYIDHDPSDGPVITGFSINGPNDESVIWYSEYSSVQNARDLSLITAAPNLLGACQEALQTLEREGDGYRDLQAGLRAVIAYAEREVDCGNGFVIAATDGGWSLRDATADRPPGDPDRGV